MKLEGYSNYEIYPETGQVWSYKRNRFISPRIDKRGYYTCLLYNDNKEKIHWRLNRLIWTAVNGEIPEGLQINHIDEDKSNNTISNLNTMTPRENINWGTGNERRSKTHSIPVIGTKDKITFIYFPSATSAEIKGFDHRHISSCCRKSRKTHKGYQWQYVDDYLADWWEQEMERIEF